MNESAAESPRALKVLFVCIGNSCRSPMAESILRNMIKPHTDLMWEIDSAALRSWNIGYTPEERCLQVLAENGLSTDHIGRQIELLDFERFDFIFGMDDGNIRELHELAPSRCKARIQLLGDYSKSSDKIILDPYFEHGIHGFRRSYEQITKSCDNFVKEQLESLDKCSVKA